MHLYGLHNERVFVFDLNYFVLKWQFKAFYRYIYLICDSLRWVSVHHCEALLLKTDGKRILCFRIYFIKAQRWYCECTQIKVDPLQFRMMYYSYLYEQKLRRILSCFHYQEKNASDRSGASMSCKVRFSFHSSHKPLDMRLIVHIYIVQTFKLTLSYAWTVYIYRFYFRQVVMIWEGCVRLCTSAVHLIWSYTRPK